MRQEGPFVIFIDLFGCLLFCTLQRVGRVLPLSHHTYTHMHTAGGRQGGGGAPAQGPGIYLPTYI